MSRNDIPNSKAPNFQERVRETLMTYLGKQGNVLDRGLTVRDLVDAGVIRFKNGFSGFGSGPLPIEPGNGSSGGEIITPDLTPPPAVTGLTAIGAVAHVFVEHAAPAYSVGHGHGYTILYGKIRSQDDPPPVFQTEEEATAGIEPEIARFFGSVYAYPSNPGTTWHMWAKWVTNDGVASAYPAGGTNGVVATTNYNAAELVEAVQGVITETDIYRVLSDDESMADAVGRLRGIVSTHKAMQETLSATATVAESVNVEVDALSGSLAQKVAVLESKFGESVASLQQSFETTADALGHVGTQYTVRTALTSNGTTVVGGFGLVGTANESAPPTIDFGVLANKFFIAAPATHNLPSRVPFTVITTPTSDGDGGTINPGVYIDGAYIKGGSISGAAITGGTITGSKLIDVSADKLTAGSLKVGEYIQSAISYDYGSGLEPVWKIDGSGNAKLNNATVRGTVWANNGQFKGTLLGGSATTYGSGIGLFSGWVSGTSDANYRWRVGTPSGARIQWNGSAVEIYNAANVLTLSSGGISASQVTGLGALATQNGVTTGQVTGLGWMATRNYVNWETDLVNIPAFGGFAYLSSITAANISTYIASAAIGEAYIANGAITNAKIGNAAITAAKIQDAEIGTLKIAGNAVTVPSVDIRADTVSGSGALVQVNALTINLNEPGLVYASFCAAQNYGAGMRSSSSFLEIAGVVVMSAGGAAVTTNISIAGARYLGAGSHVVRVFWMGQDANVRVDNRVLFAIGAMR